MHCKALLVHPMSFNCGHSFCFECLGNSAICTICNNCNDQVIYNLPLAKAVYGFLIGNPS